MRTKCFLISAFMTLAMSASAQVQLLYMDGGRNVIDRNKKLYWMDGDSDPCFDILNYKKTGNKETFNLKPREKGDSNYSVVITLQGNEPTEITISSKAYGKQTSKVKTNSGSPEEDKRVRNYFNGLAGNPTEPEFDSSTPSAASVKESGTKGATDKVSDAAKSAFGKVKGLFKKKKDK